MTHVEFDINLSEIWKAIGYMLGGIFLTIIILLFLFRNFRIYQN